MALSVMEEHIELAWTVRDFLERNDAGGAVRAAVDGGECLPGYWPRFAAMGWLGLHVPERFGGSGYGLLEVATVTEELGRACAPGPFLPVTVVAALIAGADVGDGLAELLTGLVRGDVLAGLAPGPGVELRDGRLEGTAVALLGAERVDCYAVVAGDDVVVVDAGAAGVEVKARDNLDPTRRCVELRFSGVVVPADRVLADCGPDARRVLETLVAAEAAGAAAACREMAVAYAKQRVAFGQPIGGFQAVKHHCAAMLVDERLALATAWHAACSGDPVGATAAAAVAIPALQRCAKRNIQVHGGIGFTWEHDAHVYLRRAGALAALIGPIEQARRAIAERWACVGTDGAVALPTGVLSSGSPQTAECREAARRFREQYTAADASRRTELVVDSGYMYPQWGRPWGLGAGPRELAVISEELAGVDLHGHLGPTGWVLPIVLPTIIIHGTPEQQTRWIRPSLCGEIAWCQLFSEPGAGSDLASLSTRATRTDGGWLLTGQKVWTSNAHNADHGLALVRTNPDTPKHHGLTCVAVDMRAAGVDVRPLRQATGVAEFNEVFLDQVFVPDDDVIGDVNAGWTVARSTLDFERASLGGAEARGDQPVSVTAVTASLRDTMAALWRALLSAGRGARQAELGELLADDYAIRALNAWIAAQALQGAEPGVDGNLAKLVTTQHVQRVSDLAHEVKGSAGVFTDGDVSAESLMFVQSRMTTIAGGTTEVLLNVIAERALGLPRN